MAKNIQIDSNGKWRCSVDANKQKADELLKEIRNNKHIKNLAICRYNEEDPNVIDNLKYVLNRLKEISHIKRIELRLALVVSDLPVIQNFFDDLDTRLEELDLPWMREYKDKQNLLEVVKDVAASDNIPEEVKAAASELQTKSNIIHFGRTKLDRASQEYIVSLLSRSSIPQISVSWFDRDICKRLDKTKDYCSLYSARCSKLEDLANYLAQYKYGQVESIDTQTYFTLDQFASLLQIVEDAGVRRVESMCSITAKNDKEVEKLFELAEQYKAIQISRILVKREDDYTLDKMDSKDVQQAFDESACVKKYHFKEQKQDMLFARKFRRAIVNNFNIADLPIKNYFDDVLRKAFKQPEGFMISFDTRNHIIEDIRNKIGQDDLEMRKFIDDFTALIVPKLKKHGIVAKFDGYKDVKTFFVYCLDLISAAIQKLFGNSKSWDDLEEQYQTRLKGDKIDVRSVEIKFTEVLEEQAKKLKGVSAMGR